MEILEIDASTNRWVKFNGNFNVCSNFWDSEFSDIKVIERIGSESSQGEVYKIKFSNIEAAGKILPILSDKSLDENNNEIEIAKMVSEEVINGNTKYFPIVYGFSYCKNTKYNENSLFIEESYRYALFNILCKKNDWTSSCKKRMFQEYKNFTKDDLEKEFSNIIVDIPSHVLISSLARSDLREFTRHYKIKHNEWIYIILEVINALRYLNEKMNILHGDLHCGNILMNIDSNHTLDVPIIHDFGKSQIKNVWTMYDRVTDIGIFLTDLTLNSDVPETIKIKITKVISFIDDIKFSPESYFILGKIEDFFI